LASAHQPVAAFSIAAAAAAAAAADNGDSKHVHGRCVLNPVRANINGRLETVLAGRSATADSYWTTGVGVGSRDQQSAVQTQIKTEGFGTSPSHFTADL
jgi:hypothetical protein